MKKKLIKILIICALCLWVIIFATIKWLSADEPLSKESQVLLDQVQMYDPDLQEHPYFFELGFDAKSDIDQILLGRMQYQYGWSKDQYLNGLHDDSDSISNDPRYIAIEKFKGQFLSEQDEAFLKNFSKKASNEGMSYRYLLNNKTQLQRIYTQQRMLNHRFQQYLVLPPSEHVLLTSMAGAMPPYTLIMRMHYLYLSHLAFQGDQLAITKYTKQLMAKYQQPMPMIHKMFINEMISQNLNILNDLNRISSLKKQSLPQLTLKQISLKNELSTEFANMFVILNNLLDSDKNSNQAEKPKQLKQWIFFKLYSLFYNKNISINHYAEAVQSAILLSELNDLEFKKQLTNFKKPKEKPNALKNYWGQKILGNDEDLNWEHFVVRPRLLNQKIRVFNVLLENRHVNLKQLNQNAQGHEYYQKNGELCIKSPAPNDSKANLERYRSCLKI